MSDKHLCYSQWSDSGPIKIWQIRLGYYVSLPPFPPFRSPFPSIPSSLPDRPHPEPNLSLHFSFALRSLSLVLGNCWCANIHWKEKQHPVHRLLTNIWLLHKICFLFFFFPFLLLLSSGQICSSSSSFYSPFFSTLSAQLSSLFSIFQSSMMIITNPESQHEDYWGLKTVSTISLMKMAFIKKWS